jgi:hypothetical protein
MNAGCPFCGSRYGLAISEKWVGGKNFLTNTRRPRPPARHNTRCVPDITVVGLAPRLWRYLA